jgi:hypothetical protein
MTWQMRRNASGGVEATPELRQVVAYFRACDCMKRWGC